MKYSSCPKCQTKQQIVDKSGMLGAMVTCDGCSFVYLVSHAQLFDDDTPLTPPPTKYVELDKPTCCVCGSPGATICLLQHLSSPAPIYCKSDYLQHMHIVHPHEPMSSETDPAGKICHICSLRADWSDAKQYPTLIGNPAQFRIMVRGSPNEILTCEWCCRNTQETLNALGVRYNVTSIPRKFP